MRTVTEPVPARARPETEGDHGVDEPRTSLGSWSAGLLMVVAAALLAAVAAWWLLAEPVESPIVWTFDQVHDHGVQEADLPGIAGLLLAALVGLRGLGASWRSRRGTTTQGD